MVDNKLVLAAEKISERFLPRMAVEHIFFLNLDPGQSSPRGAQLITRLGKFLFLGQQRPACS